MTLICVTKLQFRRVWGSLQHFSLFLKAKKVRTLVIYRQITEFDSINVIKEMLCLMADGRRFTTKNPRVCPQFWLDGQKAKVQEDWYFTNIDRHLSLKFNQNKCSLFINIVTSLDFLNCCIIPYSQSVIQLWGPTQGFLVVNNRIFELIICSLH